MNELNHFGELRLEFLKTRRPDLLRVMERGGMLERHLLRLQRSAEIELEQLVFAGMVEEKAEAYVRQEYIEV